MKKKKNYTNPVRLVVAFFATIFYFSVAQSALAINTGLKTSANHAGLSTSGDSADVYGIVGRVIEGFLGLIGVLFLIMTIYAGYLWMTAQGNAEQTKKAKTMIVQAVIGMLVVFGAYALTEFVLTEVMFAAGTASPTPPGE